MIVHANLFGFTRREILLALGLGAAFFGWLILEMAFGLHAPAAAEATNRAGAESYAWWSGLHWLVPLSAYAVHARFLARAADASARNVFLSILRLGMTGAFLNAIAVTSYERLVNPNFLAGMRARVASALERDGMAPAHAASQAHLLFTIESFTAQTVLASVAFALVLAIVFALGYRAMRPQSSTVK